ncbi:MAG: CorA family divalent cation transporter [Longicatena sp.]
MFYQFHQGLNEVTLGKQKENELLFGICNRGELDELTTFFDFAKNSIEEYDYPARIIHKMDSYFGYDFGILHAIQKHKEGFTKLKVGLYIKEYMILVVCDDEAYEKHLYDAVDKMNQNTFCLEHVVNAIINCVIANNQKIIEDIENKLTKIDEDIINNKTEGFNQRTRSIRNDLAYLTHYYEQLLDVCEELLQDENNFFANDEVHHLRILADRVNRLAGNIHLLKDYLLQIREACQSQVDMNLNRIMYFFTIVTTIFLPLTLIVGWYGMNFKNMPELEWQYGYAAVAILSIVIVLVCLWIFRKKKLLK